MFAGTQTALLDTYCQAGGGRDERLSYNENRKLFYNRGSGKRQGNRIDRREK